MKNSHDSVDPFSQDERRADWHDASLWWVRQKRDLAATQVKDWELLRESASKIKEHTLRNLHDYLVKFEQNAIKNGIKVHWAKDALEHNNIVLDLLKSKDVKQMVKSKSMLTEECGLNDFLENNGVDVIDTDLGERIIQWMDQKPSHIVMPAIHLKKKEIGEIFTKQIGLAETEDPNVLTNAARTDMRKYFMNSKVALTGVNFALADTGAFVVCTNEGNADMGVHLADMHIASMGIEKLLPKTENLGIFLRLLARSATGQAITTYTSHFRKPAKGKEIHIILVDNGRSDILAKPNYWKALKCIRCGACMNTCPVFRKKGGHSYQSTIPGPIGAILAPHKDPVKYKSLPFKSSLCGSCTAVCPVKIDIDKQLYSWRQELEGKKKSTMINLAGGMLSRPTLFDFMGRSFAGVQRYFPGLVNYVLKTYTKGRALPDVPNESFKEWYKKNGTTTNLVKRNRKDEK